MQVEKTIPFQELEEIHQFAIAKCFAKIIKARKPDVIKRIFVLGNPDLVLVFENDVVTNFHIANEQSKTLMKILFRNYLKEAL